MMKRHIYFLIPGEQSLPQRPRNNRPNVNIRYDRSNANAIIPPLLLARRISAGLIGMVFKLSLFSVRYRYSKYPFGFFAALFQTSIDILMIVLFFLQVKFNQIQSKALMKAT